VALHPKALRLILSYHFKAEGRFVLRFPAVRPNMTNQASETLEATSGQEKNLPWQMTTPVADIPASFSARTEGHCTHTEFNPPHPRRSVPP